jgi:hypothetical protein
MTTISDIRRANIRLLVEQRGGLTKLSRLLGYKNPSFLSQMLSETAATREVTERTARRIEEALGLPADHLDVPVEPSPKADLVVKTPVGPAIEIKQAPQSADTVEMVSNVIRAVGAACEAEGVQMGAGRFAELVAIVYADSVERGVRPDHVKQLVRLLR